MQLKTSRNRPVGQGRVGGCVRAESRCRVVPEPHPDTQELCSQQPVVKCIWVGHDLSPAFTSEPSQGIEGEDPTMYNARTPETGTNHLGGPFDCSDAKAV